MPRCAHNMVPFPECRQHALHIVQQLVLSPGGDDDMGTLLGLMPTAAITDLELKTHILRVGLASVLLLSPLLALWLLLMVAGWESLSV